MVYPRIHHGRMTHDTMHEAMVHVATSLNGTIYVDDFRLLTP